MCIVAGVLITPVAVVASWARIELVDSDRFVATFAPLAEVPAVQDAVAAQVSTLIESRLDVAALTGALFSGLEEEELPRTARLALRALEGPVTAGMNAFIEASVQRAVESPAFSLAWSEALRVSHRQFEAAMKGSTESALVLDGDGALVIQLGPVVDALEGALAREGFVVLPGAASVDASLVVIQADALLVVQAIYTIAVPAGMWLPLIALLLLTTGALVARRPMNAVVWAGGGIALAMIALSAGVGIGRSFFVAALSPESMSVAAAEAVFAQLLVLLQNGISALIAIGAVVAIVAWLFGPTRSARTVRSWGPAIVGAVRRAPA
ncbi:hypothetical protein [Agromyces italicus]|uniref:hypothetical protein n=1 Tax=Agromyces italicus TaxID=279572 RepID=UPI00041C252F|nr:hypothetical protein [Agromyces italicus]